MQFFQPPATSSILCSNIHLFTLFSNTLNVTYHNVRDQVSHPYKTKGKIMVLYILIYLVLVRKWEDKRLWREWYQVFPKFNLLLISSWIPFWFVAIFSDTWTLPHFWRISYTSVNSEFILYFVVETQTYTWPCLYLLPNQPPYKHVTQLLCFYLWYLFMLSSSACTFLMAYSKANLKEKQLLVSGHSV
jgi:hypothetical protein